MQLKLFLLVVFLLNFKISNNAKTATPGFFLTMPKTLIMGKNETICLSIHHIFKAPLQVTVDLIIREKHYFTTKSLDSGYSCFELYVPNIHKKETQYAHVKAYIRQNRTEYYARNQDPILIYSYKEITFIETDRTTYKSQDVVKFRILVLKHNLLPPDNFKISQVRIRNPLGVDVVQWENVSTVLGLAQLEHELSQDSLSGKWKIEANGEVKTFDVSKYVLPRFKVTVMNPKVIYFNISSVSMKVCAKYSYGGIVRGTAYIRLRYSPYDFKTIQAIKEMSDGCGEFIFLNQELALDSLKSKVPLIDKRLSFVITATVTEQGTDKIELTTARSIISLKPYHMKLLQNDIFIPGIPYYGNLQFNYVNTNLTGEVVEICYNIAIKKSWNYLKNEQCSNFTLSDQKSLEFYIPPLKNSVIHLQINARSLNHSNIADNLLVVRLYSPSMSHIVLHQTYSPALSTCQSLQQFSILYTTDNFKENETVTFYYLIKTRGQIYKMKKINQNVHKRHINYIEEFGGNIIGTNGSYTTKGSPASKFEFKFKLDKKIISSYQLLVYYVTSDGELISTSKEVKVELCLINEVKANWSHKQITPGGTASLLIETKSDSFCSITSVDKATQFLDGVNFLNINSILKPFLEEKNAPESRRKTCIAPKKRVKEFEMSSQIENVNSTRKKRFVYSFSEDYDAYDIINKWGVITITNFKVVTKRCYTGPLPPTDTSSIVQPLMEQYDIDNDEQMTHIRSFFPTTWLWELLPVKKVAVIHRVLPHRITSWVTNVLCVSAKDGIGLSETTEISVFQPFFVDVLTPYSLKLGETLYLQTLIFNYLTHKIPIRIKIKVSEGLASLRIHAGHYTSYCISSNSTIAHVFELKAVKVEEANVTVLAELDPLFPGECGPDILINKRDIVHKKLLIEREGYPIQESKSALLCHSLNRNKMIFDSDQQILSNISWNLITPNDHIKTTSKVEVIVNNDILGQAIENFDDLISMPTGCGEQIMATLAPQIQLLKYLNVTKSLTSTTRHKIVRNLKIGYQRILNYIHKDGSFSAFGFHDPAGSVFLTAFVVKTLQRMKQHIYVDQKVIDRAVSWILNSQLENGCFSTTYHVFQDMGGTSAENNTAALTAYVMISLLDANIRVSESIKTNAKYCIRGHHHLDKYTLAICSYALLRINWYSEADRMLKKLFQISTKKDNMIWWTSDESNGSIASDIEITSYVLMALLLQKSQENLAKANSIVQWLSTQQGLRGGFYSTQDTVVGLDALTKYSEVIPKPTSNINVNISINEEDFSFEINAIKRSTSKKQALYLPTNNVKVNVDGEGCVLVQVILSYFIKKVSSSQAFKLDTQVFPLSNVNECSTATLSSCFTYNLPNGQSNMAILEVSLPSGYQADRVSLYKLVEDNNTSIRMFEEMDQKVVLYLTKIKTEPICINFDINKVAIVQGKLYSFVKLYEYYKPEYSVLQFYNMSEKCEFRNISLPNVSSVSANSTTTLKATN